MNIVMKNNIFLDFAHFMMLYSQNNVKIGVSLFQIKKARFE